jgi:hypothetical protein
MGGWALPQGGYGGGGWIRTNGVVRREIYSLRSGHCSTPPTQTPKHPRGRTSVKVHFGAGRPRRRQEGPKAGAAAGTCASPRPAETLHFGTDERTQPVHRPLRPGRLTGAPPGHGRRLPPGLLPRRPADERAPGAGKHVRVAARHRLHPLARGPLYLFLGGRKLRAWPRNKKALLPVVPAICVADMSHVFAAGGEDRRRPPAGLPRSAETGSPCCSRARRTSPNSSARSWGPSIRSTSPRSS